MKRILTLTAIISSFTVLCCSSCKKKDQPDCGCDAPTRAAISDTANLSGTIYFSTQPSILNSAYFANKFFIVYTERNCSNCVHTIAICNETILPQRVLDLKLTNQSLQVEFAGDLKPFCRKIIAPGDYTYENIHLTKIKVQ
jgi:hypothetical protein